MLEIAVYIVDSDGVDTDIMGETSKLVILLQMGTTYRICTIKGLLNGHSDFIRQDIISFVRVEIKKWRNHCPRCCHSVDRCRRFPLSNECLSIAFYSKFLIKIKSAEVR